VIFSILYANEIQLGGKDEVYRGAWRRREGTVLCQLMVHSPDSYVDDGRGCGYGGNNLCFAIW
jgi:hypothetical protein